MKREYRSPHPIQLVTFSGRRFTPVMPVKTMAGWHAYHKIRCASPLEFEVWAGVGAQSQVCRMARRLFCEEGELSWCRAQRISGNCVLDAAQWAARVAAAGEPLEVAA